MLVGLKSASSTGVTALSAYSKQQGQGNSDSNNNKQDNIYNPICWRFPESKICGCTRPCRKVVKNSKIFEIIPGLYVGPLETAYRHEFLYNNLNIRSILNVSR